jgi:hypothetical protein
MDTNKIKTLLEEVKNGTKSEEEANKEIMADYGKSVTKEQTKITELTDKLASSEKEKEEYKNKFANLEKVSTDSEAVKKELEDLKTSISQREEEDKKKGEDKVLTDNILTAFGDKKFVNERTRNSLIQDIKNELAKDENKGKGISDIFNDLTKEATDIFASEQDVVDMAGMGNVDSSSITKEVFDKMSYNQRLELKQSNPTVFKKYNN